ncbi:unnamed protein product [Caenorhabditis sp. 36 PRJEB53466]|nr:unnamed protein product [Caenorhabditis sp. 36 PRJEB53466]
MEMTTSFYKTLANQKTVQVTTDTYMHFWNECNKVVDCYNGLGAQVSSSSDEEYYSALMNYFWDTVYPACKVFHFRTTNFYHCLNQMNLNFMGVKEMNEDGVDCELNDREFFRLFQVVRRECGEDAVVEMMINQKLAKAVACPGFK